MEQVILEFTTSDENIRRLCKLYWELGDDGCFKYKLSELSSEFNVSRGELSKLVAQSCVAFSVTNACSNCGVPYAFFSRVNLQDRNWPEKKWICDECKLEQQDINEAQRLADEERYRRIIENEYGTLRPKPVRPSSLSLESAVYLLTFTRLLAVDDYSLALPLDSARRSLSPTTQMDTQILSRLLREQLISVNPNSLLSAFEGSKAESFYLTRVHWKLPTGPGSISSQDLVFQLEETLSSNNWPPNWPKDCVVLWKKVALHECLQYLGVALDSHGFIVKPGEKTFVVFENLLESYSVAQIYNLVWRATKDAAAFYVRGGVTRQHAANTIIGNLQRYGDRAKTENWLIKPFSRRFDCSQSMVSETLFNFVLRIGDDGFNMVPDGSRLSSLPNLL